MAATKRKRVYDLVQSILWAQEDIRLAVVEAKTRQGHNMTGGGGHAHVSDPTAAQAERLLTPVAAVRVNSLLVRNPETWLYVIQMAYGEALNEGKMAKRYFAHDRVADIAGDFGFEPPTVYVAIKNFTNLVIAAACQYGLVKVV